MSKCIRLIAFYLPQFHPIPENDEWWGNGFTEWTNTAKAKPMFRGHYQPHVPADLGFYDLRVSETRIAQAEMASGYGIEAFCYYHYWFGGRRILERPFNETLDSGKPEFPFCLCWANETWTGVWHGNPKRVLIEQTYPGIEDHQRHFELLLRAFTDRRYLTVDGKPLFLIYRPQDIPQLGSVLNLWRETAIKNGLSGLFIVGASWSSSLHPYYGELDGFVLPNIPRLRTEKWVSRRKPIKWIRKRFEELLGLPTIYPYEEVLSQLISANIPDVKRFPCLIPNWDNTPRSGSKGVVLHGSTPELFRVQVVEAKKMVRDMPSEEKLMFVKSWNEWAEGNHLEPDLKFGKGYLEVLREEIGCK